MMLLITVLEDQIAQILRLGVLDHMEEDYQAEDHPEEDTDLQGVEARREAEEVQDRQELT